MEHPIVYHLSQCGLALGLGVGLGVWYDLLRGGRRACPSLTWLFDLVFALSFLPSLGLFALLVGGGQFEPFFYPLGFLGWGTYELGISPWLQPCFFAVFSSFFRALKKSLKKRVKIQKKFFSFWSKWSKIDNKYSLARKRGRKQRRWPT